MAAEGWDLDAERLSELIGAIYDCVIDSTRWEPTLSRLCGLLDCINCILSVTDLHNAVVRVQKIVGIEPEWIARMQDYAADAAALRFSVPDLRSRALDEPFVVRRDVSDEVFLSNRSYREWGAPQGHVDVIALHMMRGPDRLAEIAFCRHESVGLITDREIRLLRMLAPHLRRAVTITDLIDMKSLETEAFSGTLDAVAVGIILVAEDGAILHANRAAQDMLERKTPVAATRGKLRVSDFKATDRLRRAIAVAAANEPQIGNAGVGIALCGQSGGVATAHVLPLARGDLRTRLMPRAAAAVFVTSDLRLPFARLDAVADAFGLTRAETRLLDRLMRGDSMAEAAAAMNIAMTTAKTHRSRLLAKTGTRRQAGLISLVHRLVPPVSAIEAAQDDMDGTATADKIMRRS
jgi:DNA-binding CsgD family transcriptional regulator/PAS domain-containing protein